MVQGALREGLIEVRTACAPRNAEDAWGVAEGATRDAHDSASKSADDDVGAQGHGEMHAALHALIERALAEQKDAEESLERALEHARVTSAGEAEALEREAREAAAAATARDDGNGDDASTLSAAEQRKRAKEREERGAELIVVRRRREHDARAGAVRAFNEAAQRIAELEVEHDAAATAARARLTALHEAAVRATKEAWRAFREASAQHWHTQRTALAERGTALRKQLDESVHSERERSEQDLASERERGAMAAQKASRAAARDDALVNSLVTEWVTAQQRALKVALARAPVPPPKPARAGKLQMHDSIEALFEGGDEWFPGIIAGVNADGTYDIQYDDGDAESSVSVDLIRSQHGVSAPPSPLPTELDAASRVPLEHRRNEAWNLLRPLPQRLPYSAQRDIEQARLKSGPIRAAAVISALVGELCAAAVARAAVDEAEAEVAAACAATLPELEERLKEAEQSEGRRADEKCAAALVSLDGLLDAWNSAHLELAGMCVAQLKAHQSALRERAEEEQQACVQLSDQSAQDSAASTGPRASRASLRKK